MNAMIYSNKKELLDSSHWSFLFVCVVRYFLRPLIDVWCPHGSVYAMNCAQQKEKRLATSGICAFPPLFVIGVTSIHSQFENKRIMRCCYGTRAQQNSIRSVLFFFFLVILVKQ